MKMEVWNFMKINEKSIRVREINEKDLRWMDYVDMEHQRMVVLGFWEEFKYTSILKPSLDLLYFRKLCENRSKKGNKEKYIIQRNGVEYTDIFIVVNMDGKSKKSVSKDNDFEIEAGYLYRKGIYQLIGEGEYHKYVEYKRSGNAAKKGKHIFIREDFYHEMMDWTWLGCAPKELDVNLSYVEVKAYEALVNSNIKGTVKIEPDEILLLDDMKHPFVTQIAKIKEEEGRFSLERCEETIKNNIFDGECLIDNSIFETYGTDSGMMLLRNFFFKSCGFRTDIQGYYKEYYGADYENALVEDRFGKKFRVKDIKMIVTMSSFKLFKFRDYLFVGSMNGKDTRRRLPDDSQIAAMNIISNDVLRENLTYDLWRRKVYENGCVFGIVKSEEEHREKRKFTYQMLNSMHFSEEDIHELLADDVERFIELRTDYDAYEKYIGNRSEDEEEGENSYTGQFIIDLAKKNPIFRQTGLYKMKRSNDIRAFKQKLYEGKINIEADYCTLCSMPWELLKYSVEGETAFSNPVLKKGEIFIAGLEEGAQITLCRNPHSCASNVVCATNHIVPEIEKWFSFQRKNGYSNIVVISPWEWDVMEALNGADFDSDEVLCIKDEIVLKRAMELQDDAHITAIPHVYLSSDSKGMTKMNNFLQQYEIDHSLRGNKIGVISNYAQVLNSFYWDSFEEKSRFTECRDELYDDILILSVLMGLEIDKAKHAYSFDAQKVASEIFDKYAKGGQRKNRPIFMCFIDEDRHGEAVKKIKAGLWLNCPMDYVAKKLYHLYKEEEKLKELQQMPTIDLADVFEVSDYKGCDGNKVENVLGKMNDCISQVRKLNVNKEELAWVENAALKTTLLDDTYYLMQKNKITLKEMKRILYIILEKDLADKMKKKGVGEVFYECLLVNNRTAVSEILGQADVSAFSRTAIKQASTEFLKRSKESAEKKQINYAKCNKLFEAFLCEDVNKKEKIDKFAAKMKADKNVLNIAYMLQVISADRDYAAAKSNKLISLSMLYHVWPKLFTDCIKNA